MGRGYITWIGVIPLQGPSPGLGPPTLSDLQRGPILCFVGTLHMADAKTQPQSGCTLGWVSTPVGICVPLVINAPMPPDGQGLKALDQRSVTVCGPLVFENGQLAVEVRYASPGSSSVARGVSPWSLVTLAVLGLLPVCE